MVCWRWARADLGFSALPALYQKRLTPNWTLSSCSVLYFCHEPVRFGQLADAHEVHGSPSVRKASLRSLFFFFMGIYLNAKRTFYAKLSLTFTVIPHLQISPAFSLTHFCFWCRDNLKGLYRGDVYSVYNCQKSMRASRPALVCWMGYTSFTAAHLCIGIYWPPRNNCRLSR